MISLRTHSLLPLLLFLLDIRLLPEQYEEVKVFTTDSMLLTATFFLVLWCLFVKFYFLLLLQMHVYFLQFQKKIDALFRRSHSEMFCKKGVFLPRLHAVDIGWPVLNEKVILRRNCFFFFQIILPAVRMGSLSNEFKCSGAINKFKTGTLLQDIPLFDRTP